MTTIEKRILTSVLLIVVAAAFTALMLFVGSAFAGAGHGTLYFAAIAQGPGNLGIFTWPLIAALLPWRRSFVAASALFALSIVPPFWAVYLYEHLGDGRHYVLRTWDAVRSLAIGFLICFLLPSIVAIAASFTGAFSAKKEARS